MKKAGIMLPLFSVPGNQGIGDLGQKTLTMINAIADAGYSIWAMLPLSPSADNNPYHPISSFAGDPVYINIDRLAEMGLLTQSSIINCNKFKDFVDYDTVRQFKEPYFLRAFKAFRKNYQEYKKEFEAFKREAFWLNAWTAYEVFRCSCSNEGWSKWEEEYRNWPEKQEITLRDHVERIFYIQFLQFIFYKQFKEVVAHAREKGLDLMMTMPFFQMTDSAEVWTSKKDYMIHPDGTVAEFVGNPPEIPGNPGEVLDMPVYNLEQMSAERFKRFRDRVSWLARYYKYINISQFKAFDVFWKVPKGLESRFGTWKEGPGTALLELLKTDNPDTVFLAEDAGPHRPALSVMESEMKIPTMDVLENRMETKTLKRPALPNSVLYTSIYTEPSLEEDYVSYSNNKRIALRRFFKKRDYQHRAFHDLILNYALDSDAELVILNMTDVLGVKIPACLRWDVEGVPKDWAWKIKDFKTLPSELKKTTPWLEEAGRKREE